MVECAYGIPSTRTITTDTELDELIATDMKCDVENNEIVSSGLDQIDSTDTDDSSSDDWEDIMPWSFDYYSTMDESSLDETEYMSSGAKILIEEFKFMLQEIQQESSKSPSSTTEDNDYEDLLIWRIQRAIKTLQASINTQGCE
ncbi:unnamed protein product [Rotaria sordida]|uniref:Uncharacterized protein n=1 Tax=Rotaria sordida TaxID=392033 RepID=A0A813WDR5_9BILA|nr:unnamed protein product [Rotaria sordida]CAF0850789.1 unnamed protein product [Rotaria sordida]